MAFATGQQFTLTAPGVEARITELAAGLRGLTVRGTELVQDYPAAALPSAGSGIVLVPWPNRVADGRWRLAGTEQLLDVTEPALGNASHGLLRNTGYRVLEQSAAAITLAATVFPQHGYPFHLDTRVTYALEPDGIRVTHDITNVGADAAPVGIGTHPYLRVGETHVDDLVVRIAARTRYELDARKIPTGTVPVDGSDADARRGAPIRGAAFDTTYTDLEPAPDGLFRHRLEAPDGRVTELWSDAVFSFVQVFTTDAYTGPAGTKIRAVAIEPMTCAPNALNTGDGLRWIEPGTTLHAVWGIRLIG